MKMQLVNPRANSYNDEAKESSQIILMHLSKASSLVLNGFKYLSATRLNKVARSE